MDGRFEVRELEQFVSIVESGNLRLAALRLNTGQPALSRLVRKLETGFGTTLLNRHPKGISPTADGRMLFSEAQVILNRLACLTSGLNRRSVAESPATITVGIPCTVPAMLAPRLAHALKEYRPYSQVRFREGHDGEVEQWLADGAVQIALTYAPQTDHDFETTPVHTDTLALVMPPSAREAQSDKPIDLSQVVGLPLIMPGAESPIRRRFMEGAIPRGGAVEPKLEVQGLRMALAMVKQGLGYTVAPLASVGDELKRGDVVAREITRPFLAMKLHIATQRSDNTGPAWLDLETREALAQTLIILLANGAGRPS